MTRLTAIILGIISLAIGTPASARVETIMVHGPSIEGNLEGNEATRKVHVILPRSYDEDTSRRYPVVYFLHGFTATADRYLEMLDPDDAVQSFGGQEMIVVIPDSHTKRGGSFYASGSTVGDFETFIAKDLVEAIDTRFRTIADRESRGLSGHSMGGYGTLRIGMKHPDVFSSIYPMAPCCTQPRPSREGDAKYETMDPDKLTAEQFWDYGYFAWSAAFSPNPQNPPYYWDLGTKDGAPNTLTVARWAHNSPAAMISQYSGNLKRMEAIAMDVGEQDFLLDEVKAMHAQLDNFGVTHEFMLFEGDHTNRVKERFRSQLLPFFAKHLDPEAE
ncbi:alpha/beta hydrolase [Qipengyuania sp. RANM35]|uniref:alpha/beta hydrolase n=1 Tax=Qipengyuania sp. RANM35 TaxID=3068635 RepID=UPI0034DB1B84